MSDLWKARFAVKRAVLDLVAQEHHDDDSSAEVAHHEYLSERLDRALEEYSKLLLLQREINLMKEKLDKIEAAGCWPLSFIVDPKAEPRIQYVPYLDPQMPA